MKTFIEVLVAALVALFITGCSSEDATASEPPKADCKCSDVKLSAAVEHKDAKTGASIGYWCPDATPLYQGTWKRITRADGTTVEVDAQDETTFTAAEERSAVYFAKCRKLEGGCAGGACPAPK